MWTQVLGTIVGLVGFSILSGVPKKFLLYGSITGAVGWLIYLVSKELGTNEVLSMFMAALVVSFLSHIFARVKKAPVTIFLIPGILPLVPGVAMVRFIYYNNISNSEMSRYHLTLTLQTAGVIAIAILIVDSCFRMYHSKPNK